MIIIANMEQFRDLFQSQIDNASLIIIEYQDQGYVYKARDRSGYFDTWEHIAKLIVNTLAFRHTMLIPDGFR